MNEFHLLRPYFLILIVVPIILFWLIQRSTWQPSAWLKVCDPELLQAQTVHLAGRASRGLLQVFLLFWLLACFILAGPSWQRLPQPTYQRFSPSVIILDLSPLMLETDILPSRLARAKFKIHDILKQSDSAQVGLVVFAQEPYTVSPVTTDAETLIALVPELHPDIMPAAGSRMALGLARAKQLLEQAGISSAALLLITASSATTADIEQAKTLAKSGFYTTVLGLGKAKQLAELAQAGKGKFLAFTDDNQDVALWIKQLRQHQSTNVAQKQVAHQWLDQGRIFLWLLFPAILCLFRRGWLEAGR